MDIFVIKQNPQLFLQGWTNDELELEMDMIRLVVKSLRSLRSQLAPNERHERRATFVHCRAKDILSEFDDAPVVCKVDVINGDLSGYLNQQGNINVDADEKLKKITCDRRFTVRIAGSVLVETSNRN
ncbi:hypothetical protein PHJA_002180300 [Phtheirospermum japonicum]|uniref:Uncharacterized protein n=1 Tax=Phtheirospermum japonicum TaxID=374723 RepID=A0A830CQ64_9LAMI|nr:hypothetical protein PHJA_002180300 [Phtheirospermum japonicum]